MSMYIQVGVAKGGAALVPPGASKTGAADGVGAVLSVMSTNFTLPFGNPYTAAPMITASPSIARIK
jgi:hypothetical protein